MKEKEREEDEEAEETEYDEYDEFILSSFDYSLFYYGEEGPDIDGVKVKDREEALNQPILKEIREKYELVNEEHYGGVVVMEYKKSDVIITVIDDQINGRVLAVRNDEYPLSEFVRDRVRDLNEEIINEIGEFEKREFDKDKIIYYFNKNIGEGLLEIFISFYTKLDVCDYDDIEVELKRNRAEISLEWLSRFICCVLYVDEMYYTLVTKVN